VGDQKRGAEDRKPQLKAEPGYHCMVVHGQRPYRENGK
jgi:hypothetical protein